ncbi:MAG: NAD(P)-dependent glycerol-3-phosphate dehydrogenase [Xanthomonadales bacterium]|nr:NAD(P)-dependent glycerol-3-phosphate dehydrogenase [Xanthomonadales bacterium]MDH4019195.1 NAD(P)-dependent glycerol-3-phosphate dehydrogenase [Xanthomonadales bacterium]
MKDPQIAVLGAGSWGTALALQLDRSGSRTILWDRDTENLEKIRVSRFNQRYLPGIDIPESIVVENDILAAVKAADHVLVVTPSHAFATVMKTIRKVLVPGQGVAWACKGFEPGSGRLLHQVAMELLAESTPLAIVTGPSFAKEVAMNLPTAVTVAGPDRDFTGVMAAALHGGRFRAYTSDDMIGAELGGAVKNVMAVATGICDGMQLGDNARAALITRGLAEMMRLGAALKAKPETLMGLAGAGDLILTCTGDLSRNRRLGLKLGKGKKLEQALDEIGQVVEGVNSAAEVQRLAIQYNVNMPITEQVNGIIHLDWDPAQGVASLMAREQKAEYGD